MFSDSHCRYTWPTCGSGFNQTGGHVSQRGCSQILTIDKHGLPVDLVSIRLVDMGLNVDVLRSSL